MASRLFTSLAAVVARLLPDRETPASGDTGRDHPRVHFSEAQINAGLAKARALAEARDGRREMISERDLTAYQAQYDVLEVLRYGDSGICRVTYKPKGAPAVEPSPRVLSKEYTAEEINALFAQARARVEARDGKIAMIAERELATYQEQYEVLEVLRYGNSGVCRVRYKPRPGN